MTAVSTRSSVRRPPPGLPAVTAGDEPGRAVLAGELVERPHRVDHQRRVRLGQRVDRIVPVQDLRLLAGPDADADRRAQLVVPEHLVEDTRAAADRWPPGRTSWSWRTARRPAGCRSPRTSCDRSGWSAAPGPGRRGPPALPAVVEHASDDHVAVVDQPLRHVLAGGGGGHRCHHQPEPRRNADAMHRAVAGPLYRHGPIA